MIISKQVLWWGYGSLALRERGVRGSDLLQVLRCLLAFKATSLVPMAFLWETVFFPPVAGNLTPWCIGHKRPAVPAPDDRENRSICRNENCRGNRSTRRKLTSLPVYAPQIPHEPLRRLTACRRNSRPVTCSSSCLYRSMYERRRVLWEHKARASVRALPRVYAS